MDLESILKQRTLSRILKEQYDANGGEYKLSVGKVELFATLDQMANVQTEALGQALQAVCTAAENAPRFYEDRSGLRSSSRDSQKSSYREGRSFRQPALASLHASMGGPPDHQLLSPASAGSISETRGSKGCPRKSSGHAVAWRMDNGDGAMEAREVLTGSRNSSSFPGRGVQIRSISGISTTDSARSIFNSKPVTERPGSIPAFPRTEQPAAQSQEQRGNASTSSPPVEVLPSDHWARTGRSRDAIQREEVITKSFNLERVFVNGKWTIFAKPKEYRDWLPVGVNQTSLVPDPRACPGDSSTDRPLSAPMLRFVKYDGHGKESFSGRHANSPSSPSAAPAFSSDLAYQQSSPGAAFSRQSTGELFEITEEGESTGIDPSLESPKTRRQPAIAPQHSHSAGSRPSSAPLASTAYRLAKTSGGSGGRGVALRRSHQAIAGCHSALKGWALGASKPSTAPLHRPLSMSATSMRPPPPLINPRPGSARPASPFLGWPAGKGNRTSGSNRGLLAETCVNQGWEGNEVSLTPTRDSGSGGGGLRPSSPLKSSCGCRPQQLAASSPKRSYERPWSNRSSKSGALGTPPSRVDLGVVTVEPLRPGSRYGVAPPSSIVPSNMLKTMLGVYEDFFELA